MCSSSSRLPAPLRSPRTSCDSLAQTDGTRLSKIDRPLYHWLLGDNAIRLPPIIYQMHATAPRVVAVGTGTVTRGTNVLSRVLASLHRLPASGVDRPLTVTLETTKNGERISRVYPDATVITHQSAGGPAGSFVLVERVGPFALWLRLSGHEQGIDFQLIGVRWHGVRLPQFAWPRLQASERADGETYRFHVRLDLPLIGRLIEYWGALQIAP